MTSSQSMRRRQALLAALGAVVVIVAAACNASTPAASVASVASVQAPTTAPTPTATATATLAPTQAAVTSAAPSLGSAVPTSIDPCQLFTQQQASQLTGASFGPGKESTTSGNGRICTYGAQTLNVFNVEVVVAPDVATAQAARAEAEASIKQQAPGLNVTEVSGLGDAAATANFSQTVSGKAISGTGVYVLKGRIFISLNDVAVGSPASPSVDAMKAAAQTVLGQLP